MTKLEQMTPEALINLNVSRSSMVDAHDTEQAVPSLATHLVCVAIVSLTAVPGALLMRQGQLLSGIAVVGISFTIVSFMEPLAALGIVFALAPLDQVFALDTVGGVGFSGSKILSVPLFLAFIANAIRGRQRIRVVPSMVLLVLIYMLALISSIWSELGDVSLKSSASILLLTMMIVVAITMLRNQRCLEQIMAYVVVGGASATMYSLLFSIGGGGRRESPLRASMRIIFHTPWVSQH